METDKTIVDIRNLYVEFPVYGGSVNALNGVSLTINRGEIVGIVGESGCGKSVTAMMTMRLIPDDVYRTTGGEVQVMGRDVLTLAESEMVNIRGSQVSMIFQEPQTALNPTKRVGKQMTQVILRHQEINQRAARDLAIKLLGDMHISEPKRVLDAYPFELSGGMRQRVLIAMAFSCEPKLIIADEPTTALDVTVQKQVLLLLRGKARELGTAVMFITHDMAVVSQFCDRIYVMYAGSVIETGATGDVINFPGHPYTQALLAAVPDASEPGQSLCSIPGSVPNLNALPDGCLFADRCNFVFEKCRQRPEMGGEQENSGHRMACWLPQDSGGQAQ